eukprot:g29479.t1
MVGARWQQEFLVVFDTGSGNIFLPDRQCQSTSCMTKHTYDKLLSKGAQQVPNATEEAWKPNETALICL